MFQKEFAGMKVPNIALLFGEDADNTNCIVSEGDSGEWKLQVVLEMVRQVIVIDRGGQKVRLVLTLVFGQLEDKDVMEGEGNVKRSFFELDKQL
ncbi:MAG: hypothetical protein Q3993_05440 [Filifactor alocis]|nr:hypothetical protein [Filifactor alocis]